MHKVHKVKEMLCEELEAFANKEKIDEVSLKTIDTLAHAIKNIDKILDHKEMEEAGYSNYNSMRGNSYGGNYRYDEDMSFARGRGRYSNEDRYPNEGMYSRENYSRENMRNRM